MKSMTLREIQSSLYARGDKVRHLNASLTMYFRMFDWPAGSATYGYTDYFTVSLHSPYCQLVKAIHMATGIVCDHMKTRKNNWSRESSMLFNIHKTQSSVGAPILYNPITHVKKMKATGHTRLAAQQPPLAPLLTWNIFNPSTDN